MDNLIISDVDSTMEKVVKQIYVSCDKNNCDLVPVSTLIDFVYPYMAENLAELDELKAKLDPNNSNPSISSELFYNAMNEWTQKLKDRDSESSFQDPDQNFITQLVDESCPFGQSTPRSSLGYYQIVKNCSGILNLSLSGSNSVTNTGSSIYQDQIKELQVQVKRVTHQYELSLQQLTLAEESNETLLNDNRKLTKDLQSLQAQIDKLQRESQNYDELKEELTVMKRKYNALDLEHGNTKKLLQSLHSEVEEFSKLKEMYEKKLDTFRDMVQTYKQEVCDLKDIIEQKDVNIMSLTKSKKDLEQSLYDKEESLAHHKLMLESLNGQVGDLQKNLETKNNEFNQLAGSSHRKGSKEDLRKLVLKSSSTPMQDKNGDDNSGCESLSSIEGSSLPNLYVIERSNEGLHNGATGDHILVKSLKDELLENAFKAKCLEIEQLKEESLTKSQYFLDELNEIKAEMDALSEKIIKQFNYLDLSPENETNLEKLKRLVNFLIKRNEEQQCGDSRRGSYAKLQIKLDKLEEKNNLLKKKNCYLQEVLQKENKLKTNFTLKEDLEFLTAETSVQKEEIYELKIENKMYREEIDELNKNLISCHNNLIAEKAKNTELLTMQSEINMNFSTKNNLSEQTEELINTNAKMVVQKWSWFEYFISFIWPSNTIFQFLPQTRVNCLTNDENGNYLKVSFETFKKLIYKLIVIFLFFYILLIIYVQLVCKSDSRSLDCPLDWLLELFFTIDVNSNVL